MRNHFAQELTQIAADDDRVVMLSGDIGNRLFDEFKSSFPNRFYNCGVAEANMMGMASGMALAGLRPVVYTIVPFVTLRCFEQIRDDVCYQDAPVVIVGVGGGLSYASLGPTHHACEDIAVLRTLPNLSIIAPGDPLEVRGALRAALAQDGPSYIRLGKRGEPLVHDELPHFEIGKSISLSDGSDVCILSTGALLPTAVEVGDRLNDAGVSTGVTSFHTIKPLDTDLLRDRLEKCRLVVTLEEHSVIGGLGSAVAEWMVDRPVSNARLLRIGTADKFIKVTGSQDYARRLSGLDVESIQANVLSSLSAITHA